MTMPTLLNPWMLGLGAGAMALPFVIHWLTRPHPIALPLSTIRFVRQIVHQRRTANRLRDLLILLLRAVAVGLLAYAFARPFLGSKPLISSIEAGSAVRIVVLDDSLSMAAASHGITPFERGRQRAADLLSYRPGLQANLLFAGPRPRPVFDTPTTNLAALREALATAVPHPYALSVQQTINRSSDMLARSDSSLRHELVVISDFQRSNWSSVDFSGLPADTLIQLEPVGSTEAAGNVAVLRVAPQGRAESGQTLKLEIDIGNYTDAGRNVKAEVALGDRVFGVQGICPRAGKTTLTADVQLPPTAGWLTGTVRLLDVEDALAADNVRPFVVNVVAAPTYALITREPAKPEATSSQFLERALAPDAPHGADGGRVMRLGPDSVDLNSLGSASVIVVDHPGKLPSRAIEMLAAVVRRGRPLLYVAAEPLDAVNLKMFGEAAGTDLHMPVDFVPSATGVFRRDLFIADAKKDQAPFQIFGDDLPAVLAPLRIGGGLATMHREGGLQDDVLASYSDRSAALVVTACGAGSFAVLNADLSESTLPSDPVFVPLIGELINRLLATHRAEGVAVAGEPFAVYLPPEAGLAAGLQIVPAQKGVDAGVVSEESGFVLWRSSVPLAPGVYEVTRNGRRVFALAAGLPGVEADLAPIDLQLLKTRLAGGRHLEVHSAASADSDEENDNTWAWLLSACAACFVMEWILLRLFRT